MTERGHTLLVSSKGIEPIGVVVFFQRGRIPISESAPDSGSFDYEAFKHGFAVMHVATGHPLDFFFADTTMTWAAEHIEETLDNNRMKQLPVFFAGLSLGGTRALRFAAYLIQNDDLWLEAAGVAIVDAPLDMERLWHAEKNAVARNFHQAAAGEGRWVTYLLEQNLGGKPADSRQKYIDYSPYTYTALNGGEAELFSELPVLAFHEPDVNWWIENRRKSYYAMNSLDMAGFINQLKLFGNENAELITTWREREGVDEGSSPHTWSFVNNAHLIGWFLRLIER